MDIVNSARIITSNIKTPNKLSIMLYSYSPEQEKRRLFSIFLLDAMNGKVLYSNEVKKVLREVKDLCNQVKTIYNIDRNYFDIITDLAENFGSYYSSLDIENLDYNNYSEIRDQIQQLDKFEYAN